MNETPTPDQEVEAYIFLRQLGAATSIEEDVFGENSENEPGIVGTVVTAIAQGDRRQATVIGSECLVLREIHSSFSKGEYDALRQTDRILIAHGAYVWRAAIDTASTK